LRWSVLDHLKSAAKRWLADNGSLASGTPRAAYRHDLVHAGVRAGVYPTRSLDPAHRELGEVDVHLPRKYSPVYDEELVNAARLTEVVS
jgi:hypothetical protein